MFRNYYYLIVSTVGYLYGQGNIQSPYAQYGLGNLELAGNARTMALGYTGLASTNTLHINQLNPALNAYSRNYVIFEAGGFGQMSWLSSTSQRQYLMGGSLQYLNMLFPIGAKNWTIVLGLIPYSFANARYLAYRTVQNGGNSPYVTERNVVDGGLNQVHITHAFKLPIGFSVGIQSALVFGTINRNQYVYPEGISNQVATKVASNEIYRVLEFKPGISYNRALSKTLEIGIGGSYTFSTDLDSKRDLNNAILQSSGLNSFDPIPSIVYQDTFYLDKKPVVLPTKLSVGTSVSYKGKLNFGIDYTLTDYHTYNDLSGISSIFINSQRISTGLEWIPKYDAMKGIYKRFSYRIGGHYMLLPFRFANVQIAETAATFGFGIPLGRSGNNSINAALMYGIRGTTGNNLIEERFFRFSLGVTINDRWFLKYRMD